jgi:hypothetical protein
VGDSSVQAQANVSLGLASAPAATRAYNFNAWGGVVKSKAAAPLAEEKEEALVSEPAADTDAFGTHGSKDDKKGVYSTIYLSDAKLPDGVDINQVESAILGAVSAELQKYFADNGLTGLRLELKVENGKVKSVKVVSYKGSSANQKDIENIMQKVRIGSVTGTLDITLETN